MEHFYNTERLELSALKLTDADFIRTLVNTKEWIKYIGERNIHTNEAAENYVQKIIDNTNINYWVVSLTNQNINVGVVTFIKRDYLDYYDIGFAFMPDYTGNGYALEASKVVLNDALNNKNHLQILATTLKENTNSIKLLEKMGLSFQRQQQVEEELLMVYGISK